MDIQYVGTVGFKTVLNDMKYDSYFGIYLINEQ